MNDEERIKKIIAASEAGVSERFTSTLNDRLARQNKPPVKVARWSSVQVFVGFLLVAGVSGGLLYRIASWFPNINAGIVPAVWAFTLVLVLSEVLYYSTRREKLP